MRLLCIVALAALIAAPAVAQIRIQSGVDLFDTATNPPTAASFAADPIPPGFFCPGSPAFTGTIFFSGVPLVTSPPGIAGGADTLVERLADAVIPAGGGSATVPIVVRALRLASNTLFSVACSDGTATTWRATACLCGCELQPITNITLTLFNPQCGCGVFSGQLSMNVCITFIEVNTGRRVGPVRQTINLAINNVPWCEKAPAGSIAIPSPFGVDTNCDGRADLQVPGTSNFAPGWTCPDLQSGLPCEQLNADKTQCHENPNPLDEHQHCFNPVCDHRQ